MPIHIRLSNKIWFGALVAWVCADDLMPLQGKHSIGDRDTERDIIPMCKEMGLGVAPWGVLGGGRFTGRFKKVLRLLSPPPSATHRRTCCA